MTRRIPCLRSTNNFICASYVGKNKKIENIGVLPKVIYLFSYSLHANQDVSGLSHYHKQPQKGPNGLSFPVLCITFINDSCDSYYMMLMIMAVIIVTLTIIISIVMMITIMIFFYGGHPRPPYLSILNLKIIHWVWHIRRIYKSKVFFFLVIDCGCLSRG